MGRRIEEIALEAGLTVENFHPLGKGLHMEIMDTQTMDVWQTMADVTREDYAKLDPGERYRKVGIGSLAGDCSYFRRSPDAGSDGAMDEMQHAGHVWKRCARPAGAPSLPVGQGGPHQLSVIKYHSIVYAENSEVGYLQSSDGEYYVKVIDGGLDSAELVLPEGWEHFTLQAEKELMLHLPCPATVFFFANLHSYQGPVPEPDRSGETR